MSNVMSLNAIVRSSMDTTLREGSIIIYLDIMNICRAEFGESKLP